MNQYTGIEEYWSRLTRVQDEISFEHEVLVDTEEAGIAIGERRSSMCNREDRLT